MARFKYTAVSMTGEQLSGLYTAPDRESVIQMLRLGGYFPTEIKQQKADEGLATKQKIKIKPLAGLCSQMAAMLRAGVPIAKTLEILKSQTEDKPLKKVMEDVHTSIQRGSSLSEALNPYAGLFPVIFINMIEAGEASGTLDMCLERAGVSFTKSAKLNNKVRNAMIYPTVILVVMIGLLLLMLLYVMPQFIGLYSNSNVELPGITQAIMGMSDFLQERWYIVIGMLVVIFIAIRFALSSDGGRTSFDRLKFRLPLIHKMLNKVYAARFARTLASLSSAGVALPQALSVTARSVLNRHMEKELYKVVDAINQGGELSGLLEKMGLLPPMIVYMTRLGEESGTMDTLLLQAADFYDEESDSAVSAMLALLEPALIILMAAIVVPVLMAAVLPMFDMVSLV
jgi:type IV pilus assembly protein PilC